MNLTDTRNTIADYISQIASLESQVAALLSWTTPESGYKKILMYGFSFEYPEYMYISVLGLLSASGADEHSGIVTAQNSNETEYIFALWVDTTYPRDLDNAIDGCIAGTQGVTSTGERVTSIINGHTVKYQSFTAVIGGKTYHSVISYWNCDSTLREYGLEYMTVEGDAIPRFLQILDSFACH